MLTIPSSTRTIATPSQNGTWKSSCAASPPKSPTRASQAIDDSHCTVPGRTIDFPNGSLASGTWAVPVRGPQVHRMATGRDPMIVPTMMATRPSWNPSPSTTASVPANTPDSSMFGVNHTVNIRCTPPYLESAGIGAMPWPSSARSPVRVGRTPSKTLSSSVASAMAATLPGHGQFPDTGNQMSDISDFIRDGQRSPVLTGQLRCPGWLRPGTVGRGAEPGKLIGQGFRAPVRVQPAGVGQHPHAGAAEGLVLRSHTGAGAAKRRPVGGDADDRQPAGTQPPDLGGQLAAAFAQLVRAQLVRAGGGAGDDVGDAEPDVQQLLLLIGAEQPRREP